MVNDVKDAAKVYYAKYDASLNQSTWKINRKCCENEYAIYTKALEKIYADQTIYGDIALVQIVSEFNKHLVPEAVRQITKRGKRMLPIIEYSKKNPLQAELDKTDEEIRIEFLDECVEAINKGVVLNDY